MPNRNALQRGAAAALLSAFLATPAFTTEYDLSAYFAEPDSIAAAIGSNDVALMAKLEGMSAYVADNGLEERFADPVIWRVAVADIVAGRARANEAINGFALEMLLLAVAETSNPSAIGLPFAELETAADYYSSRGFTELAAFLSRISNGNTDDASATLPAPLKGKLGATAYHARVSVLTAQEAGAMLALMPQVKEAAAEIIAFQSDGSSDLAERARLAITQAETENATEFFTHNTGEDYLAGRTIEQAVKDTVARELDDPYQYADNLGQMKEASGTIEVWLREAARSGRALFLVYDTN